MKVITTATTIGQAFKNAGRVREVLSTFGSHGFWDLINRMHLARFIPQKISENLKTSSLPLPERLRMSFEELGPTFVKLGQVLATRPDLVPENFVEELEKLQDQVPPVPFEEIEQHLTRELNAPLFDIFSDFDREPLAAASIAQVHAATLRTGEKVAVKIQRPGIDKIIQNDTSILRGLALSLEKYIPEVEPFNPTGLVEEFFQTMVLELDFRVEANNMRKIKANLKDFKNIVIPHVYAQYATAKVLILERLEGIRFSEREAILGKGSHPEKIIEAGCDAFFHMVMHDGLFHGDLHAGNLFVLKDGRIGMIDFGIVGRLSRRVQDSIITMFIAIMDEDYETLANEYLALCSQSGEVDVNQLQKDLMDTISPYVGMALGEVNAGRILLRSTTIAARHKLRVPRELMLLFRAIVTMDGLGKRLDPTFDILPLGTKLAKQVVTTRYSRERLLRDVLVLGRDMQDTFSSFPRLLKRFLRVWAGNNFAFETKSKELQQINRTLRQTNETFLIGISALCLTAVGITFLILGRGPTLFDIPIISLLCFVSAAIHSGRAIFRVGKDEK